MLRRHIFGKDDIFYSYCNTMKGPSLLRRDGIQFACPLEHKLLVNICPRMSSRVTSFHAVEERFGVVFDAQRAVLESSLGLRCCEAERFRHVVCGQLACSGDAKVARERSEGSIVAAKYTCICVRRERALLSVGVARRSW